LLAFLRAKSRLKSVTTPLITTDTIVAIRVLGTTLLFRKGAVFGQLMRPHPSSLSNFLNMRMSACACGFSLNAP
jgi:hypothetical protein